MNNPLVTYDWNRKLFTSQIRLWELSRVGAINVKIEERTYGSDFFYYTLDGELIASYYKDDTFGHGSQATGIELRNAIPDLTYIRTDPAIDKAYWSKTGSIRRLQQKVN
jgi:hypothetical protein